MRALIANNIFLSNTSSLSSPVISLASIEYSSISLRAAGPIVGDEVFTESEYHATELSGDVESGNAPGSIIAKITSLSITEPTWTLIVAKPHRFEPLLP